MISNKLYIIVFLLIFSTVNAFPQEFEMPGYITDMNSCDFDLNGAYDILVTCPYSDTLVILFNNGSGEFETYYYDITSLHAICGCVDEDSIPDLIAGAGQMAYYKSNGNYTFDNGIPVFTLSGTVSIYGLVDMNSDGWNDLVYTNIYPDFWGIYRNNGNLSFTNEIIQSGSSTTRPGVGLLNNDSLPDVVLTYSAFNRSSVHVNNGNLNFTEVILEENFIGEGFVMDLDNEGPDDFAFANYYSKTVPLYKYVGDDQFELQSNFYAAGTYVISSFFPGDFNQDGYDDFAVTRGDWWNSSDSLYIYTNDENWSFGGPQQYYVGYLGFFILKSEDLNGDNYPDLFMSGAGTNGNKTIRFLWNNGDGTFSHLNPVNIHEPRLEEHAFVNVSPNPAKHSVNIELEINEAGFYNIAMYSMTGQRIVQTQEIYYTPGANKIHQDVSILREGIYCLMLQRNGAVIYSTKLIKSGE